MAITVNVRGNMNKIIADLERSKKDVVDKALPFTLNKLIDQTKTAAARAIRDTGYKIKLPVIKAGLYTFYANSGRLTASLSAKGFPIPLINYGAKQSGSGVSVDILNGRKVIPGAFIATMPSGHTGVFIRVGKVHKKVIKNDRAMWSGLPIKQLFGPSIPDAFNNKKVQEILIKGNDEKFEKILMQQIKRFSK